MSTSEEHKDHNLQNDPNLPIETDYEEHKDHPGPPIEAVEEKNENGAGKILQWIVPVLVIILLLIWLVIRK